MQPRASYLVSNSGAKPFLHFSQCNLFLIPVMFITNMMQTKNKTKNLVSLPPCLSFASELIPENIYSANWWKSINKKIYVFLLYESFHLLTYILKPASSQKCFSGGSAHQIWFCRSCSGNKKKLVCVQQSYLGLKLVSCRHSRIKILRELVLLCLALPSTSFEVYFQSPRETWKSQDRCGDW